MANQSINNLDGVELVLGGVSVKMAILKQKQVAIMAEHLNQKFEKRREAALRRMSEIDREMEVWKQPKKMKWTPSKKSR